MSKDKGLRRTLAATVFAGAACAAPAQADQSQGMDICAEMNRVVEERLKISDAQYKMLVDFLKNIEALDIPETHYETVTRLSGMQGLAEFNILKEADIEELRESARVQRQELVQGLKPLFQEYEEALTLSDRQLSEYLLVVPQDDTGLPKLMRTDFICE